MFFKKLKLYYQTLKHVKPIQLYHQMYYRLKNRFFTFTYKEEPSTVSQLNLSEAIQYQDSWLRNNRFSFLNLEKDFKEQIDWNYSAFGKLWTYNLNYFEYLNQENITTQEGLSLIMNFLSKRELLKDGFEPYPISLRGINWIKFLNREKINDPKINKSLYQDYLRLADNLEYHLLANHLLENGFSLFFGSYYFQNEKLYKKARKILKSELKEQVLSDGAHYELSPMYHQIILHRVLDCYNLVLNNSWKNDELLPLLKNTAERMLGWLQKISFPDGSIPKLNDSTAGIAPTTAQLKAYASTLDLIPIIVNLSDSGYRRFSGPDLEILMDIGQIAPSYQPGHSHADSLHFVLNYKNEQIIVDTGISTYEKNERRQFERSTSSHNTVTVNEKNSSKVWGGFRVAERAVVRIMEETKDSIKASQNGYRKLGVIHQRNFELASAGFKIEDRITGKVDGIKATGHLHFYPDMILRLKDNLLQIDHQLQIEFLGVDHLETQEYKYAEGFNKLVSAKKIIYKFQNKAEFIIKPLVLDTIFTPASTGKKITRTDATC